MQNKEYIKNDESSIISDYNNIKQKPVFSFFFFQIISSFG